MSSLSSRIRIGAMAALAIGGASAAAARGGQPFIPTAGVVDAPRGFVEMCQRDQAVCREMAPGATVAVSSASQNMATGAIGLDAARDAGRGSRSGKSADLRLLRDVNRRVNGRVVQQTDMQIFGQAEYWQRSGVAPGARGDCEDIAIEKRLDLIEAGYPAGRLSFAVVYRSEIGLHTVLIAHTASGDYLLDSRNSFIELWNKPPYSWISVQAPGDAQTWRRVESHLG